MNSLIVNEAVVRAVKAPTPTETWHPFAHSVLLDELEFVKELSGRTIQSHRYELSKDGRKFFGVWTFNYFPHPTRVTQISLGFRNSIDKSISVGLCAGTYVTVCSNMMFSGEWMVFRKHTKNVLEDLKLFVLEAFVSCMNKGGDEVVWQEELEQVSIFDYEWKALTYDAIDDGIIPPTKATPFFEAKERSSLSDWFNVATNILSQRSLLNTEVEYGKLKKLVSEYV